jgi:hypothetical protein
MTKEPKWTASRFCAVATLALLLASGCSDADPTGPRVAAENSDLAPQSLVNGENDFDHAAAGALMVYDPGFPDKPGWRSFCSGALVHPRVFQTAGHCIQFLRPQLDAGIVHAAWISFQQDPDAHFTADPTVADPATGGWYEIESLHHNPDNIDWVALRQAPPEEVLAVWGTFHDSGAIVLKEAVEGIQPMKLPARPGMVEKFLAKAGCEGANADCTIEVVAYGLQGFPPPTIPPVLVRRSAPVRYTGIDPLFVSTAQDPPGSDFGAVCPGDSGGPVILLKKNGKDRTLVAITSSPAHPFAFPCTGGAIQYRTDTESHLRFIREVIRGVSGG